MLNKKEKQLVKEFATKLVETRSTNEAYDPYLKAITKRYIPRLITIIANLKDDADANRIANESLKVFLHNFIDDQF